MNESSSMEPSAHQPALFLIQTGISDVFDARGNHTNQKRDVFTVDLEFPY